MKMLSVHKPFFLFCALFFQAQAGEDQTRSQPQRHDPELPKQLPDPPHPELWLGRGGHRRPESSTELNLYKYVLLRLSKLRTGGALFHCRAKRSGRGAGIRAVRAPGDFDKGFSAGFMCVLVWHLIMYVNR
jgi:hypothetical protein